MIEKSGTRHVRKLRHLHEELVSRAPNLVFFLGGEITSDPKRSSGDLERTESSFSRLICARRKIIEM